MKAPYLRREKDTIFFTGEIMDIYIPKSTFDRKLSKYNGEFIETLGLFIFEIKTAKQAEANSTGIFKTLKFPNPINFKFTSQYKYTGTLREGKVSSNEYIVFRLEEGDIFMANTNTNQSSNNVIDFITALHGGAIPNILKYEDIIKVYLDCLDINKTDLKNPSVVFELIISELCRDNSDMKTAFRDAINGNPNYNPYAYDSVNLTQLPSLHSTFASLSFQDMDESIITSINRTLNNDPEKESPIEKIIKY